MLIIFFLRSKSHLKKNKDNFVKSFWYFFFFRISIYPKGFGLKFNKLSVMSFTNEFLTEDKNLLYLSISLDFTESGIFDSIIVSDEE